MNKMRFNLFVDESCHLEHDHIPIMCIGYIKVPHLAYRTLYSEFRDLKNRHRTYAEIKWSKFSKSRLPLYRELVDFFFENPLEFRCVLIKYKERLNHLDFNGGEHDNFYYKMTYYLLRPNLPDANYNVFMDIKDTRGKEKLEKITEVFKNYYHGDSPFIYFQHLRSHENVFFQLTDFFIGAITYKTRVKSKNIVPNAAKMEFIEYLEKMSGYSIDEGTAPWETKFNIFDHQPQKQS